MAARDKRGAQSERHARELGRSDQSARIAFSGRFATRAQSREKRGETVELWRRYPRWGARHRRPEAVLSRIFLRHGRRSEQCVAPVFAALRRLGLGHKLCDEFLLLTLIRKRGKLVFARKSVNRLLHCRDF